jgi:glycyl-tRNA synthetase beta chain
MTQEAARTEPLLIELGCEELPAGQIDNQLHQLAQGLKERLLGAGLIDAGASPETYATPRRLAVIFPNVRAAQADQTLERKGPAVSAAFDAEGQPTRAAEGFARSVNLAVEALERLENEQGSWLFARVHQPGQALTDVLPDMLEETTRAMAGARSMRWSDRSERFLRPVRWVVVLYGDEVLPIEVFGLTADRHTHGHRIHAPGTHAIDSVADYLPVLKNAFVEPDPLVRQRLIREQSESLAEKHGLEVLIDEALLAEVAGLTEWPHALMGGFDENFLEVPPEALICSMQQHQKCFPTRDSGGELAPKFIAVANIESLDVAAMTAGFERVIRPRLADARFFYDQDRKTSLAERRERLADIKFQEKMGSVAAKSARLQSLSAELAEGFGADVAHVRRAAELCKCDLVTEMVGEFPELQGTMGRYYALADGEPEAVALALETHYLPRNAGDQLPPDPTGRVLALADRLDTILGVFAAGQKPKGGKDPFALRRAALAVVRILIDSGVETRVRSLLDQAVDAFQSDPAHALSFGPELVKEVSEFIEERLRSHLAEQGIETNTFNAAAASHAGGVAEFVARARSVQQFADDPQADSLIAANKRIANLLKQSGREQFGEVSIELLADPAERALNQAVVRVAEKLDAALKHNDYPQALTELAELKAPVDHFFDEVMVMVEDATLRTNRLGLLSALRTQFLRIADVARLGR